MSYKTHMCQRVFISRKLKESSPIKMLGDQIEILDESLLDFEPVPFKTLPVTDWLFFYSQQGVYHFFEQWKGELLWKNVAAFGPKTGNMLREMGHYVAFTGDGVAKNTARAFLLVGRQSKVTFVRANHSRKSLQQLLEKECLISDLVVYNNKPRNSFEIPFCDILIFTSPLNVSSYFSQNPIQENQKVIAIGNTTLESIKGLGIQDVSVPEHPTEEALAQLLKKYIGT